MNKHERVGVVLMLSGIMYVLGSVIAPTDPTTFETLQILLGFIILMLGSARFIWSERKDE